MVDILGPDNADAQVMTKAAEASPVLVPDNFGTAIVLIEDTPFIVMRFNFETQGVIQFALPIEMQAEIHEMVDKAVEAFKKSAH
jgi:hypothetical protein